MSAQSSVTTRSALSQIGRISPSPSLPGDGGGGGGGGGWNGGNGGGAGPGAEAGAGASNGNRNGDWESDGDGGPAIVERGRWGEYQRHAGPYEMDVYEMLRTPGDRVAQRTSAHGEQRRGDGVVEGDVEGVSADGRTVEVLSRRTPPREGEGEEGGREGGGEGTVNQEVRREGGELPMSGITGAATPRVCR